MEPRTKRPGSRSPTDHTRPVTFAGGKKPGLRDCPRTIIFLATSDVQTIGSILYELSNRNIFVNATTDAFTFRGSKPKRPLEF